MTTSAVFAPSVEAHAFDETKHVNFTLGMILGIDDFNQEFAYLTGRDRSLARGAVGYGTLSGLQVAVEDDLAKGPRVSVTRGSALLPTGQLVCVCPGQCAQIDDWLASATDDVGKRVASGAVTFHVVLCYRDCPTDPVPLPGEPCRDETSLTVPSRLADSFRLELRLDPPNQIEENAVRAFVQWLRKIPVGGTPLATIADLQKAARDSVQTLDDGGIAFADPPAALHLDPAAAGDSLRALLRTWTTELRPHVHALASGRGGCCSGHGKEDVPVDECLLLATLKAPVVQASGKWRMNGTASSVTVDESQRPYLLHARMLQELGIRGF